MASSGRMLTGARMSGTKELIHVGERAPSYSNVPIGIFLWKVRPVHISLYLGGQINAAANDLMAYATSAMWTPRRREMMTAACIAPARWVCVIRGKRGKCALT